MTCACAAAQMHCVDMLTKVSHKRAYFMLVFFSFVCVCVCLSRIGMETECRLVVAMG